LLSAFFLATSGASKSLHKERIVSVAPEGRDSYVWAVRFSADSRRVAVGIGESESQRRYLAILDALGVTEPIRRIPLETAPALSELSWSPDGQFLLVMNGPQAPDELVELSTGVSRPVEKIAAIRGAS
jgi:hypothetical protein